MDPSRDLLGFVGIGVMGRSMAGHLLKAGYRVRVYSRTKAKAESLIDQGAQWADSVSALAQGCSAVFTMVGYPKDVEEVYFGDRGLIATAPKGCLLVDTTTSSPDLARRIASAAAAAGLRALDAPVSGGDVGARNATLSIMVGGSPADFEAVRELLELMGKTVILQGPAGSGQHAKMANQIAIAGTLAGSVEAVLYAREAGLDPKTVLQSIGSGAAGSWQLNTMVPRMLDGDFGPGFYVKHYLKDLRIALDAARGMKIHFPMLELAERLFTLLNDRGFSEQGTQALYLLYERGLNRGGEG
ncbi:MAG TPA: NAD(P)-dependent oxidoreductase [Rectinemataceae bacterium]|nr:NAD(P)-dependent oxidoreductase [Rectinemataceae bacterium]